MTKLNQLLTPDEWKGLSPTSRHALTAHVEEHDAWRNRATFAEMDCQRASVTAKDIVDWLETIARLRDELECECALRLDYERRVAVAEANRDARCESYEGEVYPNGKEEET